MAFSCQQSLDVTSEEMETDNVNDYDSDEEGGLRVDENIYIPPPPPKNFNDVDTGGPRLMIYKIVNNNFKSYAGERIVGPFHKCFTAIVGPNGSGKSNVIDSMLFVFGYRATKIRSKKISFLIHNSSEHPNCNSCTVSVHFQSIIDKCGTDYDVVPNSEFVISRTGFKDNSSHYELNKKKVQFKEIANLLRSHGIDFDHNRFLILQGEVEQIALMKPKGQNEHDTGMLEFLEDIIGTVRYKEPLEKLCEKVEVLTERKTEKLNRLRIVEKEKNSLKNFMEDAVQYLKMENIITKCQHQLYHCKRFDMVRKLNTQEEVVKELEQDIATLLNEMKAVRAKKEEKSSILQEKNKKWDALQSRKDGITGKFENVQKKDEALHAELVEINKRRKANIALAKSEKTKLEGLHSVPEKNAKNIEEYEDIVENHVKNREKEEAVLTKLMSGLREKTEPLHNERSKFEKELISVRKNVDEAQSAFDIATSKLQLYTSVEQTEKEKLEKIKESLQVTTDTLKQRRQELASFGKKIPATRASLTKSEKELQDIKNREIEVNLRLKSARVTYEEKRSTMQASKSRSRVLESLMKEKRSGKICGIYGRLGDLGAIDAKYDVAISTACGPLDNIVVDTVDTAQECIKFLRQNDIGRGTFIPLEKQQQFLQKCRQKIQTPENVLRLFDLIRVENEDVLPAFYYGLRDTLVVDNLDQATRIAYGSQRYRVVTLKGELIELSGTMSGGGRTVSKGRMGQKVVRDEPSDMDIEKLQSKLDTIYEESNLLKAKQQPLENQIYALSKALKDMNDDTKKFNIEVEILGKQEPLLRAQLKDQEKKAKESVCDPKVTEKMSKEVRDTKEHLDNVRKESESVESKVAAVNRKIEEISGNCGKQEQRKINDLTKTIDKMREEICRLNVAIKIAKRDIVKTERRIESLEADVAANENKLHEIQQKKLVLEEKGKVLLAELDEISEPLKERDADLATVKEELNKLQSRENEMKAVKIDLEQKIGENKKILKELGERDTEYTQKIRKLELHAIPGESFVELRDLSDEEIAELNEKSISNSLATAKARLPSEIPNMKIIADYQEKDKLYLQRVAGLEKITDERNRMRDIYENARRQRVQEFLNGFSVITSKLKEVYRMITLGGDAELELIDSLDPFSEGVVFSVRPPKKSWKNIGNLSGGEKTLSSLALVFALHYYKPTPLYFMDEIDAALDFKNVSVVGNYIKERTKNAQFIIISLRSNMFELADYLVGIFKTYNCTKCANLDVKKYYATNNIAEPTELMISKNSYVQTQKQSQQSTQLPQKDNFISCDTNCPAQTTERNSNPLELSELVLPATPQKKSSRLSREKRNFDEGSPPKKKQKP